MAKAALAAVIEQLGACHGTTPMDVPAPADDGPCSEMRALPADLKTKAGCAKLRALVRKTIPDGSAARAPAEPSGIVLLSLIHI